MMNDWKCMKCGAGPMLNQDGSIKLGKTGNPYCGAMCFAKDKIPSLPAGATVYPAYNKPYKKDNQKAITIGQSWNLAVASLSDKGKEGFDITIVEDRAKQFYQKIMAWQKPKVVEPLPPPEPPIQTNNFPSEINPEDDLPF